MRVFLDTNVLVSAFISRGLCADLLQYVIAYEELVVGEVVLRELRRVLERLGAPEQKISLAEQLLRSCTVIEVPPHPHPMPLEDTDDRWVLASAIEGNADVLVTGDAHLIGVASQVKIAILSPRRFWESILEGGQF